MTETQFKVKVLRYLKDNLPNAWIHKASDKFTSGIPDIFVLYEGIFAAIELKVAKNPATKLQTIVLARIERAGGMAWVVRDSGCKDGMPHIKAVVEAIKARAEYYKKFDSAH